MDRGLIMTMSKVAALLVTFVFSSLVSADWGAVVEDDIFTGKKKAKLIGEVAREQALIFECDSSSITFGFVEKFQRLESEDFSRADVSMLVRVDQGRVYEFEGKSSRRNDNYVQTITEDREKILDLLKEVRGAQSRVQIGLHERLSDHKWSGTASVRGSTREATRFLQACELE